MTRMILIALLVPLLGACADFNWRDAGRHSLESLCGSTSGCDRRCETDTGARTGDCRLGHGEP